MMTELMLIFKQTFCIQKITVVDFETNSPYKWDKEYMKNSVFDIRV